LLIFLKSNYDEISLSDSGYHYSHVIGGKTIKMEIGEHTDSIGDSS